MSFCFWALLSSSTSDCFFASDTVLYPTCSWSFLDVIHDDDRDYVHMQWELKNGESFLSCEKFK